MLVYDYDPSANTVTARPTGARMSYHYGFCPVFLNSDYLINPYNSVAEIDLYPVTSTGLAPSSATYTNSSLPQSGCMKIAGNVGYSTNENVYAFAPTSITKSATINLSPTSVLAYLAPQSRQTSRCIRSSSARSLAAMAQSH
jgi:hypothetical protein